MNLADSIKLHINRSELESLCALRMAADPSPVDNIINDQIADVLDRAAAEFGYVSWVEAAHSIPADRNADWPPQGLPDIEPPAALAEESETELLVFHGNSDDTFGEYVKTNDDYDNCASGERIEWLITAPDGEQMLVVGQYCPGASSGWLVGVARYSEDDESDLPAWQVSIEPGERSYSPALFVSAPVGSTIRCLQRGDDDQG